MFKSLIKIKNKKIVCSQIAKKKKNKLNQQIIDN